MNTKPNMQTNETAVMPTYARYPLTLSHGSGCRVQDDAGQEYLDFVSGIAVNTLGHAHPRLSQALCEQAGSMLHCSNLFHIPQQQKLAVRLTSLSGLHQAFFCNSGAEANEAAIKLARKYFFDRNSPRRNIITATQSFHGRTINTLTATGQDKVKLGFDPLPPGFSHVPLNDMAALEAAVNEQTAAILLEPLQGEGGVNTAHADYLKQVRTLCDRHGILLLLDEVQTGIGRCGTMFAYEQADIRPDILTLAKGLGGGVPIGAMLAGKEIATSFAPGTHGSTFGGNPLSCTAALTVLAVIDEEQLLDNCVNRSAQLIAGLETLRETYPMIREVRGAGLLIGAELDEASGITAADIIAACRQAGLLILPAGPQVLRFLPPLNVTTAEVDEALARLATAMQVVCKGVQA